MSLTASVVIAAVALLRLALRRAPRAIICALWAVVLLRLLCPVSLSSAVSLFGLLDAPTVAAGNAATSMAYVAALPDLAPAAPSEAAAVPVENTAKVTADAAPEPPAAADPWAVAAAVWLTGVGIMALWAGVSDFRLRRRLRTAVPLEWGVYLAEGISTAFVLGLPRPKIYLPAALPPQARQHVLRHERCHLRRGDPWWKALAFAALSLHWFNPLVWLAFALAGQDMETACDEAVVRGMDGPARADYAATLLQLATGRRAGLPLAFGAGDPARRIRHLARWKKPARWVVPAAAAVCVAAAVALLTNPAPAQAPGNFGASQSEARLTPGSAYVSCQCIYWNPVSARLRSDDTGVRYVVGEDDFTLVSRSGALSGTGDGDPAVDTTGSHGTRLTGITWGWQPFPYTDAAWADLFPLQSDGAAQSLTARHAEILYQPLSDDYFLLRVDGDLWLAQLRDDGEDTILWSIHSLVSEAQPAPDTLTPMDTTLRLEVSYPLEQGGVCQAICQLRASSMK